MLNLAESSRRREPHRAKNPATKNPETDQRNWDYFRLGAIFTTLLVGGLEWIVSTLECLGLLIIDETSPET